MPEMFNRDTYYDSVRASLFSGKLSQQQVDGQNDILTTWEQIPDMFPDLHLELRWLAYMLATTYHETSQKMWPIEEYGKGSGMSYGVPDPETGQTYYGRGYVQLTWRDNYKRADDELNLSGDQSCEWHAQNALDPVVAARIMFRGMYEGWFRKSSDGKPQTLPRYFSDTVDDAFTAREIINGDKTKIPDWSGGKNIGTLIKGYHDKFHTALKSAIDTYVPPDVIVPPEPQPEEKVVHVYSPKGVRIVVEQEE